MDTLKYYYLGDTGGCWGYIDNGKPVRLGSKHYASRICEERNVLCVDLTDIHEDREVVAEDIRGGFKDFLLSGSVD